MVRSGFLLVATSLLLTGTGCVSLNIPSVRYDDPAAAACGERAGGCIGGGTESSDLELVEVPEVPWPKFHPVPTRPVFGRPPNPNF